MNRSRSLTLALTLLITLLAAANAAAAPGDMDRSYGTNVRAYVPFKETSSATSAVAQADGRVVIAGTVGNDWLANGFVARLTDDGKLDRTFGVDGIASVGPARTVQLAKGADGTIYALANSRFDLSNGGDIYAFSSSGSPIGTFGSGGKVDLRQVMEDFDASAIAVQGSSLIVIGTRRSQDGWKRLSVLTRLTTTGQVDPSFGSAGIVSRSSDLFSGTPPLLVNEDGSIVAALDTMSAFDRDGNVNPNFSLNLPVANELAGTLEIAPTSGGGFAVVKTIAYQGRNATVTHDFFRVAANGAYIANSRARVVGTTPVPLVGGSVLVAGTTNSFEGWLKASLLPSRPGAPLDIRQSGTFGLRALGAAALPDGDVVIVGQIAGPVKSVGAVKMSTKITPRPRFTPGLRRPRSTAYSAGKVRSIEGTVRPAKGVKHVQVAILRTNLKDLATHKCPWLKKDRVTFTGRGGDGTGPCGRPFWIRATGRDAWRLKLKRPLAAGSYEVFVRAHWRGGRYNPISFDSGTSSRFIVKD